MRIVDVCAFYSPHGGGVRTYIEQKLAIAPQLGHDVTVIAPGDRDETIVRGPHARIVTLASPRLPVDRKYWYFSEEDALYAAIDAAAPDFLECSSPWRSASIVADWPGAAPRALVMHADPLSAYAYRWFEPILPRRAIDRGFEPFWNHLRQLGEAYDLVVCASRELRDRLTEGGVRNCALHPFGVDAGVFSPSRRDPAVRRQLLALCDLPEDAHLLLAVGRLSAEKRWPLVIEAALAAGHDHPVGLVLLGEGRQRARLLRQIGGNPHIVILEPERDRARFATIMASADALIHGCEAETFGLVAAEARASGIPVIVPDRGGASDSAANGGGLTYKAGSARAAAEAIAQVIAAPPASAPSAPLTMTDHFRDLFAHYERIVAERGAPPSGVGHALESGEEPERTRIGQG